MASATVRSKGRITIPAQVRAKLGLHKGARVDFIETGNGQFAIVATPIDVRSLKGMLKKPAKAISIEQMNRALR